MFSAVELDIFVFMLKAEHFRASGSFVLRLDEFKYDVIDGQICWLVKDLILIWALNLIVLGVVGANVALLTAGVTTRNYYWGFLVSVVTGVATFANQKGFHLLLYVYDISI